MFGKALFVIVKDWKILHRPKINYDKFKQWNTMQPLKILLQKNVMTWECVYMHRKQPGRASPEC